MNDLQTQGTTDLVDTALFGGRTGFEGIDSECVQTPFLKLAQRATPEATEGDTKYIAGLKPGMFFCPTTRKVYGPSPRLIIVKFYRTYNVYAGEGPESKFKGQIGVDEYKNRIEPTAQRVKSYTMKDGLRYVDARNFIVLVDNHKEDGPMLLTLSSTGVSPSRKWISSAMAISVNRNGAIEKAPIWSSVWQMNVQFFQDPKGSYHQIASADRIGWVSKADAPAVRSLFNDLADAQISVEEQAHETAQAENTASADPVSNVGNVFGGEQKKPAEENDIW